LGGCGCNSSQFPYSAMAFCFMAILVSTRREPSKVLLRRYKEQSEERS
jgi:hypothetical protein